MTFSFFCCMVFLMPLTFLACVWPAVSFPSYSFWVLVLGVQACYNTGMGFNSQLEGKGAGVSSLKASLGKSRWYYSLGKVNWRRCL